MTTADASNPRSLLTTPERLASVAFGLWMVVGLFLDGWAHDNAKPESFFTPWHGVLYSGFAASATAAILVAMRARSGVRPWRADLPVGHGLTLVALGVFAAGAVGDLVWHETLGIEVGVEALLSPTHLLLLAGGLAVLSAPVRAAWWSDPFAPSFRSFAPTVLALALLTSLAGFFLLYLSPFVNDAAGAAFTRSPGVVHDHPSTDVGELQQLLGIGSILMTTVLFAVPLHLVLRRWAPPPGTFVLFFGVVTVLFVGLAEFSQPSLVFAGLGAGLAGDAVARGGRGPASASVATSVAVLWLTYFGLYELAEGGVAWTAELWAGTTILATMVAGALGLLTAHLPSYGSESLRA
ncbi:MAG: hypothetical protein ACSLE3_11680 [Microbacteriaceae bacterium]